MKPVTPTPDDGDRWAEADGGPNIIAVIGGPEEGDDIIPVPALVSTLANVVHVRYRLTPGEVDRLTAGADLWLTTWGALPIHRLDVGHLSPEDMPPRRAVDLRLEAVPPIAPADVAALDQFTGYVAEFAKAVGVDLSDPDVAYAVLFGALLTNIALQYAGTPVEDLTEVAELMSATGFGIAAARTFAGDPTP